MEQDYVQEYIELKKIHKENDEKLKALEMVILSDHREDGRIKIVAPRKTVSIKEEVYEKLENIGITTEIVEKRKKKLEEFDVDVQSILNENTENFDIKYSKESIRVK